MRDYQKQRVLTFLDPEKDPLGAGYHIIQSKIAIGSGGFYGKGWLNGTQSHLEFLPERSTDFIFAVLCEESKISEAKSSGAEFHDSEAIINDINNKFLFT